MRLRRGLRIKTENITQRAAHLLSRRLGSDSPQLPYAKYLLLVRFIYCEGQNGGKNPPLFFYFLFFIFYFFREISIFYLVIHFLASSFSLDDMLKALLLVLSTVLLAQVCHSWDDVVLQPPEGKKGEPAVLYFGQGKRKMMSLEEEVTSFASDATTTSNIQFSI